MPSWRKATFACCQAKGMRLPSAAPVHQQDPKERQPPGDVTGNNVKNVWHVVME